jgi:hypothetical protein
MRGLAPVTLAALALGLLAGGAGATSATGLFGVVMRGPTSPVCAIEINCEAPAAGVTLIFLRAGSEVARTTTGRDGRYRVRLRPGRYAVRATVKRMLEPTAARVPSGRYARVDFSIDTGIR